MGGLPYHPETAAGHGRMTLLLNPSENGGITSHTGCFDFHGCAEAP
jgi:hypothetical protein